MKLVLAILLGILVLTAGCQSPFVRFIMTGSSKPAKGKWQKEYEAGHIKEDTATPEGGPSSEIQQGDKPAPDAVSSPKARQEDKEVQPGPRFKTRLDMMMCSLYVRPGGDTTQAELDEMFESELPRISDAVTCPRLEIGFDIHGGKTRRKTLLLYGFEQEFEGEGFLSHDVIFKDITFLQGDYVRSRAKLGCLGAIFRWTWEEQWLEENKLKFTAYLDLRLQYQNFSVNLNSGGISRTGGDSTTWPLTGLGAKLTLYDRVSAFAEGAIFPITMIMPYWHISAGLSCCLTENLEVSVAYLQEEHEFSAPHGMGYKLGFKGWSFALTFKF
jgi:hypothetical protein